jgi:flagellar hook-length control protein FliK
MPKILASSFPSAAPRAGAAADLSSQLPSTSNRASRKDSAGGLFDDLLTGARQREPAPQPKSEELQRASSSRAKRANESKRAKQPSEEQSPEDADRATESKATESRPSGKLKEKSKSSHDEADPEDNSSGATTQSEDAGPADASRTGASDELPTADPADEATDVAKRDKVDDREDQKRDGDSDPTQLEGLVAQAIPVQSNEVTDQSSSGEDSDGGSSGTDPTGEPAAMLAHVANRVASSPGHATPSPKMSAPSDSTTAQDGATAPKLGQAPAAAKPQTAAAAASNAANSVEALDSEAKADDDDAAPTTATSHPPVPDTVAGTAHVLEAALDQQAQAKPATAPAQQQQQNVAPEVRFADDNHPSIVAGVRGQLMPNGGTMHIRLDPPELGPLAVTVRLRNGVMEASFETSSDEAAKLLSHSLGSLKTSLESQGVNVERLHVQQAPKSDQASSQGDDRDGGQQQGQHRDPQQEQQARQEHQRREMIRRMWRKLRGVDDPLDMVA